MHGVLERKGASVPIHDPSFHSAPPSAISGGCTQANISHLHEAKTKENHKHEGLGNVIKHLHKLAKLSPSFSPEVRICLRSCIKHSCECLIPHISREARTLDARKKTREVSSTCPQLDPQANDWGEFLFCFGLNQSRSLEVTQT